MAPFGEKGETRENPNLLTRGETLLLFEGFPTKAQKKKGRSVSGDGESSPFPKKRERGKYWAPP